MVEGGMVMARMSQGNGMGIASLLALPTVPAEEFANWGKDPLEAKRTPAESGLGPFESEREGRFCKAVVDHPLQPSSSYPKIAGISAKTAQPIRRRLVAAGYIREHTVDSGRRGRSTILLEAQQPGIEAVSQYQARAK